MYLAFLILTVIYTLGKYNRTHVFPCNFYDPYTSFRPEQLVAIISRKGYISCCALYHFWTWYFSRLKEKYCVFIAYII
jgi:hypothetical protein